MGAGTPQSRPVGWNTFLPTRRLALGESTLNPVQFVGRDRVHVRRLAVNWWYTHRQALGLCLKEFFRQCQLSDDQRTITFQKP